MQICHANNRKTISELNQHLLKLKKLTTYTNLKLIKYLKNYA